MKDKNKDDYNLDQDEDLRKALIAKRMCVSVFLVTLCGIVFLIECSAEKQLSQNGTLNKYDDHLISGTGVLQ